MNHTKEPWNTHTADDGTEWIVGDGMQLAHLHTMEPFHAKQKSNALRIVTCVNSCAEIPDDVLAGALHYGVDPLQKRNDEFIAFLKDDIRDALTDLLNYIDSAKWTRSQQAEHDDCVRMIAKLEELLK